MSIKIITPIFYNNANYSSMPLITLKKFYFSKNKNTLWNNKKENINECIICYLTPDKTTRKYYFSCCGYRVCETCWQSYYSFEVKCMICQSKLNNISLFTDDKLTTANSLIEYLLLYAEQNQNSCILAIFNSVYKRLDTLCLDKLRNIEVFDLKRILNILNGNNSDIDLGRRFKESAYLCTDIFFIDIYEDLSLYTDYILVSINAIKMTINSSSSSSSLRVFKERSKLIDTLLQIFYED